MIAYAEQPCPETALVLATERAPRDSFVSRLGRAGSDGVKAAVFWVPFENDTRRWVQIRFRDLGKSCAPARSIGLPGSGSPAR